MLKKHYYSLLAYMLIPLAGISTDIYLPSLPAITQHFMVDKSLTQNTVTVFILAMGLFQFFVGPISDSKGRKRIILAALFGQLVSILGILFAPSIQVMIGFRFLQGISAAFMIVPARAIINDCFEGPALKKQLYYITISFALGPILGPFIGGYLQHFYGWQANFTFILYYIILMLTLVLFTLSETISQKTTFCIHSLWQNPKTCLQNRLYVSCAILLGTLIAYSMIFNIVGPFIIQTVLHQSSIVFGHIALLNGVAWLSGNLLNRMTIKIHPNKKSQYMLWSSLLVSIALLLLSSLGYFNIPVFATPVILLLLFSSVVFSIHVAEALSMFPKMAASANSLLFSLCWIITALVSVFATTLKVHSLTPIAITFILFSVFNLVIFYSLVNKPMIERHPLQ